MRNDAVFMGSIGDQRAPVGLIEREIIGGLRWRGDLYVNLRPVKLVSEKICPIKHLKPADVDFVVIRENTEDAYPGIGGNMKRGFAEEVAVSVAIYSRSATERIVRYAFEFAKNAGRKKITLFDKANAIPAQDIYRRVLTEIGQEYPEIETEFMFIDSACMWVIRDPSRFDVVLTTNLFGDIFTDLAAEVQGGLGIAASGCIHPGKAAMFEPVHGSAPQHAGEGSVSPIAQLNSLVMLLDYIGETEASETLSNAVTRAIIEDEIPMTINEIRAKNLTTQKIAHLILTKFTQI